MAPRLRSTARHRRVSGTAVSGAAVDDAQSTAVVSGKSHVRYAGGNQTQGRGPVLLPCYLCAAARALLFMRNRAGPVFRADGGRGKAKMALTARGLIGVLGLAVVLGAAHAPARDAAAAEGKGKAMAEAHT